MLEMLIGAAIAAGAFTTPAPDVTGRMGGFACQQTPPGASQECRDCMTAACDQYQADLDACGNNMACKLAAKAAYELRLADCTSCNPSNRAGAAALIRVLPTSEQGWVTDQVVAFSQR